MTFNCVETGVKLFTGVPDKKTVTGDSQPKGQQSDRITLAIG